MNISPEDKTNIESKNKTNIDTYSHEIFTVLSNEILDETKKIKMLDEHYKYPLKNIFINKFRNKILEYLIISDNEKFENFPITEKIPALKQDIIEKINDDKKRYYYLIYNMFIFILFSNTNIMKIFNNYSENKKHILKVSTDSITIEINVYDIFRRAFIKKYVNCSVEDFNKKGYSYDASSRLRRMGISDKIFKKLAELNMKTNFYNSLYKNLYEKTHNIEYYTDKTYSEPLIIQAISDTHEFHDLYKIECDIFIHTGDIFYEQSRSSFDIQEKILENFIAWLNNQKFTLCLITMGNHDYYFDYYSHKDNIYNLFIKYETRENIDKFFELLTKYNYDKLKTNYIFNLIDNKEFLTLDKDNDTLIFLKNVKKFLNTLFSKLKNPKQIKILSEGFYKIILKKNSKEYEFDVFVCPTTAKKKKIDSQAVLSGNVAFQINDDNKEKTLQYFSKYYKNHNIMRPLLFLTHNAIPLSFDYTEEKQSEYLKKLGVEYSPIYYEADGYEGNFNTALVQLFYHYLPYICIGGHSHIPIELEHLELNNHNDIFKSNFPEYNDIKKQYIDITHHIENIKTISKKTKLDLSIFKSSTEETLRREYKLKLEQINSQLEEFNKSKSSEVTEYINSIYTQLGLCYKNINDCISLILNCSIHNKCNGPVFNIEGDILKPVTIIVYFKKKDEVIEDIFDDKDEVIEDIFDDKDGSN